MNGYNSLGVGDPRRRVAITRDRRGAARSQASAAEAMRTVVRMSRLCEDTTDVRRSKLEMKKNQIQQITHCLFNLNPTVKIGYGQIHHHQLRFL
jgi:hypothetical protein